MRICRAWASDSGSKRTTTSFVLRRTCKSFSKRSKNTACWWPTTGSSGPFPWRRMSASPPCMQSCVPSQVTRLKSSDGQCDRSMRRRATDCSRRCPMRRFYCHQIVDDLSFDADEDLRLGVTQVVGAFGIEAEQVQESGVVVVVRDDVVH